ncbi:di-trans,poly-cis-decaprenylcistransferase [Candidatus Woesearchaeota archaeon]|nr:di-trans,poly-cis-decaprenylcistransferase [Candidatus Woesearchaeota archaeon]
MKENKVPRHIGIIIDGNRRFAKKLMLKPWMGHEWGAKKVEQLFDWCKDLNIKELTLYAFSLENFNRPKEEFDYLMNVFYHEFERLEKDPRIDENKIRIRFIGRTWKFNQELQDVMKRIEEKTKKYTSYNINFAMAYSGRAEIIDAVKKLGNNIKNGEISVDEINEEVFSKNLYLTSEPDLIIRTGGEKRLSGFLLWQGSYAEFIFFDKMWPEFEKHDLISAVEEFNKRQRRFGQ